MMPRRLLLSLIMLLPVALCGFTARAEITLRDIADNEVVLPEPARHLVVDDGRTILAMSFLAEDPVSLVAAWPHDIDRFGVDLYGAYRQTFPQIDTLPKVSSNAQDLNVEQILAVNPDAVLLSSVSHASPAQIAQLRDNGIAVIMIDFVSDPLANTDRSLAIVGKVIGREAAARQIISLREAVRDEIAHRLATLPQAVENAAAARPSVLLEPHAATGGDCCNSPGKAGVGKFLEFVRARNMGEIIGDRPAGKLGLEYLLTAKPGIYIATGGSYMKARGGLLIGPEFSEEQTKVSLQALVERPGIEAIGFQPHAVHGVSQQLFNSPLDILVLQLVAKWSWPDLFADLDPEATRQDLNALMKVPLQGRYWTD